MVLQPFITNVQERNTLTPGNQLAKALVITYMVGTYGPFTLVTTQEELQSGVAAQKMSQLASTLSALPHSTG